MCGEVFNCLQNTAFTCRAKKFDLILNLALDHQRLLVFGLFLFRDDVDHFFDRDDLFRLDELGGDFGNSFLQDSSEWLHEWLDEWLVGSELLHFVGVRNFGSIFIPKS